VVALTVSISTLVTEGEKEKTEEKHPIISILTVSRRREKEEAKGMKTGGEKGNKIRQTNQKERENN
jgi:hypothetical protein